jgi:hypothetical protein
MKNLSKYCFLAILLGTIFVHGHDFGGDYFDMPMKFGKFGSTF